MPHPVLLNNVDHADLRVRIEQGGRFGDLVNLLPLFPTEFEDAQAELPIVLRRTADGSLGAFALLGLDRDENLFFGEGRWRTRYVPAVQARGPFSIGVPPGGGEPTIHVDLDDPRVGHHEGAPVFKSHGGNAPYLDAIAGVLQVLFAGIAAAAPTYAAWEGEGLIEPVLLDIELEEGRRYQIPDCFTVDRARLAALDGAALERLHRADHLRPAIWLASSLRNVGRLVDEKLRREHSAG
jgi:hypothetical protein